MNCLDPKSPSQPVITKGEDKVLTVQLKDKKSEEFTDLTGVSEIIALFKNQDNSILQKKLSTSGVALVNALAGKFQILLTSAETLALLVSPEGEFSDIEIRYTLASKVAIVDLKGSIKVEANLFPTIP